MSSTLPKEQQTAFQRWEMTSFGDARPAHLEKATQQEKITKEEIAAIKESAKSEAYADAYKDAYAIGYQEGQDTGRAEMQLHATQILSELSKLKSSFEDQILNAQNTIGKDLIDLAIDLASAMTKHRFHHHADSILEIVKEAIASLPSIQQPAQIFLHPDDCELVKDLMGESLTRDGWRLISDYHLTRGGCRIETAQNLVDASVETRWSRLSHALLDANSLPNRNLDEV
jgi:flagellar assembly protein FliH